MGHLHLVLNHFPVVGLVFCLALLGIGLVKNSAEVKLASLYMVIAVAVVALAAYFTGESAEELVEHMPDIKKAMIETHEDAGMLALALTELAGLLSIAALVSYRKSGELNPKLMNGLVAVCVVATLVIGYAANLGGQIRHTEIRAGFVPPPKPADTGEKEK